jgi:inhibitor of KinA
MDIVPLGDSALLVRLGAIDPLAAGEQLRNAQLPGVVEITSAYTTLALYLDREGVEFADWLSIQVRQLLSTSELVRRNTAPRLVEIAVCYEGDFAPDLREVAHHCGLREREVIRRHTSAVYTVSCIGFTPGFPYLSGLPPELATPRRATPRKQVPAGAVAIGGSQTGVYPQESPGGWNIIGRTPRRLFDANAEPPALLAAGDEVRFVQISRDEFEQQCR